MSIVRRLERSNLQLMKVFITQRVDSRLNKNAQNNTTTKILFKCTYTLFKNIHFVQQLDIFLLSSLFHCWCFSNPQKSFYFTFHFCVCDVCWRNNTLNFFFESKKVGIKIRVKEGKKRNLLHYFLTCVAVRSAHPHTQMPNYQQHAVPSL
jgi:hypothetical protein